MQCTEKLFEAINFLNNPTLFSLIAEKIPSSRPYLVPEPENPQPAWVRVRDILNGDTKSVEKSISLGADANLESEEEAGYPLELALRAGQKPIATLLLEKGAKKLDSLYLSHLDPYEDEQLITLIAEKIPSVREDLLLKIYPTPGCAKSFLKVISKHLWPLLWNMHL